MLADIDETFCLDPKSVEARISERTTGIIVVQMSGAPADMKALREMRDEGQLPWWKTAVIEEIYPRGFADSNGDGVGDLNGITEHLGYLYSLGITAIWLAPMHPSPQVDFGYDISDYESIDSQYGTMRDFDRLVAAAGQQHISIILDMVLNHTSDRHQWFIESAASRDNPKAKWYVWNSGVPANFPHVSAFQKKYEHDGVVPPNN